MWFFMRVTLKFLLWLRYRIRVIGLKDITAKGTKGILFLPNHPALIDPVIVSTILSKKFRPRPLVNDRQVAGTVLKYFEKWIRFLAMPDVGVAGTAGSDVVLEQLKKCADALKAGDNILLYPAGHLYRSRYEKLRGNGGVERILSLYPDVRIVLVRTSGLWGSSFGRCKGVQPAFGEIVNKHIKHILMNLIFFGPRRDVTVEFVDVSETFPRTEERGKMNRWLERFYNEKSLPNTYVPYTWFERRGKRIVPEPENVNAVIDTKEIPESVRKTVYAKLRELSSMPVVRDQQTLGVDLGMDSLMIAELQIWVQEEFGQQVNSPETLMTVGGVLFAAMGLSDAIKPLADVPASWIVPEDPTPMDCPDGDKITDLFLRNAKRHPSYPIMADQLKGACSYRKMILAIMVLRPLIEKIPGERIGLIMPACLSVNIVYLAMLFAGKIPVMVNWTVGLRNMKHCLKNAEVDKILTSRQVIMALEGKGTDFGDLKSMFYYLENMAESASIWLKLRSLFASYFNWNSLRKAKVNDLCAILFTSGSENLPKAVPIRHVNIVSDARASVHGFGMRMDEIAIAMLPPFHSFGLLIDFVMPDCTEMRVVYHANPTEGDMVARLIAAYNATMLIGTPTFVHNILRNALPEQVRSLRIVITGAEKCPQHTYDLIQEKCPQANLLEGYGITECAPIVSLNKPGAVRIGSLGKILPCMQWRILDEDLKPVPVGETGMLYVNGPNVVSGYLNYDGEQPFVELDGIRFYRTGDLVSADEEGFITFRGRKKRFVKLAGEMVSLPAIEEVLMAKYREPDMELPLAVEALGTEELPVITLFTTLDIKREDANRVLREAELAPIYNIKQVVKLDAIPILGTGKTDYRTLKQYDGVVTE